MKVECPYCKEKYDVKQSQLEMEATCAMCNNNFILHIDGVSPKKSNPADKKKILMILIITVIVLSLAGGGYYLHSKGFDFMKFFKKGETPAAESKDSGAGSVPGVGAIAKAGTEVSANNMKQIGTAFMTYASGHQEQLPASFNDLIKSNTLTDFKVYIAPFDTKSMTGEGELKPENTSYAYIGATVKYGSAVPVLFEKPWLLPEESSRINVLMANGQVRTATINGVSKMTCRQVVEELTKELPDKQAVEQLLKNADLEDSKR